MPSPAAESCWAKSGDRGRQSMSVPRHLSDSASVAGLLWDTWLPESVRRRIAADLEDPGSARNLLCLLAGVHDLGKVTPAFASKVPELSAPMAQHGLVVSPDVQGRQSLLPHALSGGLALRGWLIDVAGWPTISADALAVVVAGHHGHPPATLSDPVSSELMGEGTWKDVRDGVVEDAVEAVDARACLPGWGRRPPGEAAQALLTAVVIVADWLASNTELFPYAGSDSVATRAERAWGKLQLPAPWAPSPGDPNDNDFWLARFALPPGARPRPVQQATCNLISGATNPRLLIVEAPMGEGKTEAALAAAELLAARCGAGGVMVALPTMATSDAMFRRVLDWLEHLPPPPAGGAWSTYLAHGKSRLNEDFRGIHAGCVSSIGIDEEDAGSAIAHAWLSGRKKGVLSSFVIGTIDQVLVGALRTKHLALRHLALAGKVIVLDEVHAADEYMAVYLDGVLGWLGTYGVPTLLLSATLPPARRSALVEAYRAGTRSPRGQRVQDWRTPPTRAEVDEPTGYPLLTLVDGDVVSHHCVPSSGRHTTVELARQDDATLHQALADALRDGGTVAVICNTVARAQRRADDLRRYFGDDVLLVHSRFLADDRQTRERELRAKLGPPGESTRPPRLVVVGTQVLEQSLDIDVDLMVTDLAPVDLVLQRVGRLHRHARPTESRPARLRTPRCLVTGVEDWSVDPPTAVRGSTYVYGDAALLRAATVLRPLLDGQPLQLPGDIAPLVRDAYMPYDKDDPRWPAALAEAEAETSAKRAQRTHSARSFLLRQPGGEHRTLLGWVDGGTDEESASGQAAVRDGLQGVEVLLLEERDDALRIPGWLPSGGAVLGDPPGDELARAALGCAVRLPDRCTSAIRPGDLQGPASWSSSGWLRHVLVLRAQPHGDSLRARLGPHLLTYDRGEGLIVTSGDTK